MLPRSQGTDWYQIVVMILLEMMLTIWSQSVPWGLGSIESSK
jgi:hypothetical protein